MRDQASAGDLPTSGSGNCCHSRETTAKVLSQRLKPADLPLSVCLLLSNCVFLGKSLNLSKPLFSTM